MKIKVTKNRVKILDTTLRLNAGEYGVNNCEFEFSSEYEYLSKFAIFNKKYKIDVLNNKCIIPEEVLVEKGTVTIGVYAYDGEGDELLLRYSPFPDSFIVLEGSYKDGGVTPSIMTMSQYEMYRNEILDYNKTKNKPQINGVTLEGNKTLEELGQAGGFVVDDNYVHTDNNFTNAEKEKLESLENYNDTEVKNSISGLTENVANLQNNKADKSEIPDVSKFVTKAVNDLENYYTKNESYTKAEVNSLINSISTVNIEIVETLPETGQSNIIYFVLKDGQDTDVYNEFIYINNSWELIGSTQVDLSNYYTKDETNNLIIKYVAGEGIEINGNVISSTVQVPTNISAFNNDSGYATVDYVNNLITGALEASY